jgi:hypothetical protein
MYKYNRWPESQFDHGFQCFTRHRCPQDEQIIRSYGSCVFRPCMRTGWVLETSPSDHYWWRYEVGQWLVFRWFWSLGTSDTQLARRKLGKNTHPNHGGRLCPMTTMVPSPRHHRIQQLANMLRDKSMLLKLENIIVFTVYLLAILWHDAPLMHRTWVYAGCAALRVSYSQWAALRLLLSVGSAASMMLSACTESMIVSAPPAASMILSALFCHVINTTYYHAMITVGATTKTTIGNTDDCRLQTLVNSASAAPPIGVPPKMAEFCHTSNRLLVERWCRRALWRLYFNHSAVSQLVGCLLVGRSTIRVSGLWEVSLQKDSCMVCRISWNGLSWKLASWLQYWATVIGHCIMAENIAC